MSCFTTCWQTITNIRSVYERKRFVGIPINVYRSMVNVCVSVIEIESWKNFSRAESVEWFPLISSYVDMCSVTFTLKYNLMLQNTSSFTFYIENTKFKSPCKFELSSAYFCLVSFMKISISRLLKSITFPCWHAAAVSCCAGHSHCLTRGRILM